MDERKTRVNIKTMIRTLSSCGVVFVWCWRGLDVVLVMYWCGFGEVLVWCWCGVGVMSGLVWCWRGVGVVLV